MAFTLGPAEHKTLCEVVVQTLQDAILDGHLPPGTRLIEAEIARQLSVSKATVREALMSLERLGLASSQPRRGTFITRLSPRHVSEVFSLRALLEGYAARLAARLATESDFTRMESQVELIVSSVAPNSRAYVEYDVRFHDLVFELCGHSLLQEAWKPLRAQVQMVLSLDVILSPTKPLWEPVEARDVHCKVIDALRSRDPDRAQRAVAEHMAQGERRLLYRLAGESASPRAVRVEDFPSLRGTIWETPTIPWEAPL